MNNLKEYAVSLKDIQKNGNETEKVYIHIDDVREILRMKTLEFCEKTCEMCINSDFCRRDCLKIEELKKL